ncbi:MULTISPECIES: hypothetical protein [Acinetobacter]|uniref:Uncharacterized protein n=1 Tax=Acinetobacter indicus TaxID=756892 RepID=A0A6C0Y732_9GAMM|nr:MULTISPECIES: hypothetical protein [Acinetobacter]QIC72051.1 hypothetical protein FSC09_16980 [Acinetobacter indicus]QKQ71548.1 hypothetical protein E5Y90_15050 [Acinetobacter sp. 10FS3-1]
MNFAVGVLIIFSLGLVAVFGMGPVLESEGFSENEIRMAKAAIMFIFILIPPLLVIFGRKSNGETQLEQVGKPVTSFVGLIFYGLSSPVGMIIFLLATIASILVWK